MHLEMDQSVNCLLYKHDYLSLIPQDAHKKPGLVMHAFIPKLERYGQEAH